MKKLISACWIFFCAAFAIAFLISCFSAYIPATVFSPIPFFAFAFPFFLAFALLLSVLNFFIQRKLFFLLLCCLPFAVRNTINSFAFNFHTSFKIKKDSASGRIMTWNVHYFDNLWPKIDARSKVRKEMMQTIHSLNPDFICIQEYRDNSWAYLASPSKELDSLGYKFKYTSNDFLYKNNVETIVGGVAIFSKKPFLDSGKIVINTVPGRESLIYVDALLNGKRTRIFTTHLLSFSLFPDTANAVDERSNIYHKTFHRKHNIEYRLRATEAVHERQAILIKNEMAKSPYPAIFCADMNTTPASYTYRIIKGNLQDAHLKKGSCIGAAFYNLLPTLRIDVCFADERLKILQCTVEKKKHSDHYPVITDLSYR
jgi:endonuclease/exonuclease/phosphatase family metal-dependent hydrolase